MLDDKDSDTMRRLCLEDLFFLLIVGCKRRDMDHDWVYARVREVEASPDGNLDLWFREGYKSSIITFGLTIQDILKDPENTIGIFSHTRPNAKAFLSQIKRELENNEFLKGLFPDILYASPHKDSPRWSLDDGIIVKRKGNPKEATIEAWGLVDGQPTSKHFKILVYDDVVSRESVTTPDMMIKVTEAVRLSFNLGADPCRMRFIGTRYNAQDTYQTIIDDGIAKVRIHAPTDKGQDDIAIQGESVLLTKEALLHKRVQLGPYLYACHCSGTKILMADWSWKNIEDIVPNDLVVGFELGTNKRRRRLVSTVVKSVSKRIMQANRYVLDSGSYVECTPEHRWWSGRNGHDGHNVYGTLGTQSQGDIKSLVRVAWVAEDLREEQKYYAAYLAGIIDGEGTISSRKSGGQMGRLAIHQSHEHNPDVCERIEQALKILGIDFSRYIRQAAGNNKATTAYWILGGRPIRHKILQWCNPSKKTKFISSLFGSSGRFMPDQLKEKEKIVSFSSLGMREVYNLETVTGNYIANGFASKNSQMLQNPAADKAMNFKKEWLEFYSILRNSDKWNFYIIVDPASKKKPDSDYTVILVIGLAPDHNYYLVDGIRDRLNLTERSRKVFEFHRKWQPLGVGYESYGLQADIEHIKYVQEQEGYRFQIIELGGNMGKHDRIRRLVPIFEQHRMFFPYNLAFIDCENKIVDLIEVIINKEYLPFPACGHDDALDCMSRIIDPDLAAKFPLKQDEIALAMAASSQEAYYDPLDRKEHTMIERVEKNSAGSSWKTVMTKR